MNKVDIICGIITLIIGLLYFKYSHSIGIGNIIFGTYLFTKGMYDKED